VTAPTPGPLLTAGVLLQLREALAAGHGELACSLDLNLSTERVALLPDRFLYRGTGYPYPTVCKERTIYYWSGEAFEPVSRYAGSLIKLVPTDWGPPTFEIDGIKMLPTLHVSPFSDAERKVALVEPRGRRVLDTCGGLGYFAACALKGGAKQICSFEKNASVIWVRGLNPWSPLPGGALTLTHGDVSQAIRELPAASFDAALHDPPRFGIAGELYSQDFYDQLARVLVRRGRLFHYTGTPNKLTSGRDVPEEVTRRLKRAGFTARREGDGILALRA
jgi:predicted methyltransferase